MAALFSLDVPNIAGPLSECTNHRSGSGPLDENRNQTRTEIHHTETLRRKQSLRNLGLKRGSSDTFPDDLDSIYNAEAIQSDKFTSIPENSSDSEHASPLGLRNVQPLVNFSENLEPEQSLSHSRWPVSQLEPIVERRSRSQVRRPSSVPRLQPSPERVSRVVKAQASTHSVRPQHLTTASVQFVCTDLVSHVRSFSLNDLDCLPRSDTIEALPRRPHRSSSSSKEVLRSILLCPSFPLRPTYSPPYRSPTPPGLPSFGTREAQEYRLTPVSSSSRAKSFLRRLMLRSIGEEEEQHPVTSHSISLPTSPTFRHFPAAPSIAMLRRVLGATRLVNYQPTRVSDQRSSLPPGIRISPHQGPLAQADDGTWVRGRWGTRASAHGIGHRTIDQHPLTHVAGLHSIDELVREINKACQVMHEDIRDHQLGVWSMSDMPFENISSQSQQAENDIRSDNRPTETHGIDTCLAHHHSCQCQGIHDRAEGSERLCITSASASMQGTGIGHYDTLSPENSTHRDDIVGLREYIEHGERQQARQRLEAQEKKENVSCNDCLGGFWFLCCDRSVGQQDTDHNGPSP